MIFKKREDFANDIKIVVGLGNSDDKYKNTRHNAGFMVIDAILKELNITKLNHKFAGDFWKGRLDSKYNAIIAKPTTFMNNSWQFLQDIVDYYKIKPKNILIIYDEKDLAIGKIKLKQSRPNTSHNGIKNIMQHIKLMKLNRIQIGIRSDIIKTIPINSFVLGKFSIEEKEKLSPAIEIAKEAALDFIIQDFEKLMKTYNTFENNEIKQKE